MEKPRSLAIAWSAASSRRRRGDMGVVIALPGEERIHYTKNLLLYAAIRLHHGVRLVVGVGMNNVLRKSDCSSRKHPAQDGDGVALLFPCVTSFLHN